MIMDIDIDIVTKEFHEDYSNNKITPSEYLHTKQVLNRRCWSDERTMKPGNVYIVCVPSLNIQAGTHAIVAELDSEGYWIVRDPNEGREGRLVYSQDRDCELPYVYVQAVTLDLEINRDSLKVWRDTIKPKVFIEQ
jgi:hypothetical protein